jgi:isoleucyl-tRNA synthetase
MMKSVTPEVNFPEVERNILDFWKKNNTFKKSLENRSKSKPYMFYDGPPFATGTPHYGHLLAGTIKDIVPRYWTMKGRYVERRFGWDTHGLPIEMDSEKTLNLKGRTDILNYGIGKFNEACRSGVLKYASEWENVCDRLGRWVDFRNDYKTMDLNFMDSVWWVFKQLWDQGRVYEGSRVMPYSWRLGTPLSNFEAGQNYKDVQDPAITIRFKLKDEPGTSLLAWTTTPWTVVSNMAACVGPEIDYVKLKTKEGEVVILAEARVNAYFKPKEIEILEKFKGSTLVGKKYQPLFPYFVDQEAHGAFRVVADGYVSTEDGTGVVHQAPAFGEDDHRISKEQGVPLVDPVDNEGNFKPIVKEFAGKNIKEADKDITKDLKDRGFLFKQDTINHSYPFCDRSDTPLIYKAMKAWYVRVEDLREKMVANNKTIHWTPDHIKEGRFGKWLEGARDWNISRNRFWGNPLPIWRCDKCDDKECLGSYKDLEAKSGAKVTDIHSHFIDGLTWQCNCGGTKKRIPEVLDCWFESGSMPYAQLHYPHENKELFEAGFPADFIAEGVDQTRGWFYTLMVISTALFNKAPFKNVVVNGIILAEDGKKMSKRLKNYPDPKDVMEKIGSDPLRLFLINSAAVKGDDLRFSENGVREIVRSVMLPLWNAYSFFTTYANVDKFTPSKNLTGSDNPLDKWIISRLQSLLSRIEKEMEQYHLYAVVPALLEFLDELTNWHVRRSRRRFWSDDLADKQKGYDTLYFVLDGFVKALAPFLPFVTDEIYQNLAKLIPGAPESVHLCDYPQANGKLIDEKLEHDMGLIMNVVGLGRALRARADLKVRQPLASITVVTRDQNDAAVLKEFESHIREELNVKAVLFSSKEEDLVTVTVKPDFRALGPIFGKDMGQVSKILGALYPEDISKLEDGGKITVLGREVDRSVIDVRRQAKGDINIETGRGVTVFFDTKITPELMAEGLAREFVNRIQRMRKEADYHVSDRISIEFYGPDEIVKSVQAFSDYIKDETLAVNLVAAAAKCGSGDLIQDHDIEGRNVNISVKR